MSTRPALGLVLATLLAACAPGEAPAPRAPQPPLLSAMAAEARVGAAGARDPAILGAEASRIDFARMSRFPEPGWQVPRSIAFAPDNKQITFLRSEGETEEMALWAYDRGAKTSKVILRAADLVAEDKPTSREEELRRERQRKRIAGITGYVWAKKAPLMVLPHGGDVFVRDGDAAVRRLTETKEPEIDPKPCATGERVAFVRGSELYAIDVPARAPRADRAGKAEAVREVALTKGAPAGVTRGQSDFNGQEEFDEDSGFWWSPRCDRIAYLEVDERQVAEVPVLGFRGGAPDLMMQKYPRSGAKNPVVRPFLVDVATKKTVPIRFEREPDAERYLGRFTWSADGKHLWLQALRRDQKRLELWRADATSGKAVEVSFEVSPTWMEFAAMKLLEKTPRYLWTTVVGGHVHLELRDATSGAAVAKLTQGEWDVTAVKGVDEEKNRALFTATKESPLEEHLYAVDLAGGATPVRLTPERGVHEVELDPTGRDVIDTHSAVDRAPRVTIRDAGGAGVGELPVTIDADLASLELRPTEAVTVKSPGGPLLHGALLKPRKMVAGKRYPAVVMVYGGPGAQTIRDRWSPRLLWQHLADRGVVVFGLDNRGSQGRGPAFAAAIHRNAGRAELEDQLAGAAWLASQPYVDGKRLGIYGHSYGGFMAALAMLSAPGRFAVGVAGSPVTDWRYYDTGYTERYMGTPADNPAGYDGTDLGKKAAGLQGKLFIIHALMDENVHFENTAHLVDALVTANKDFDLLVFPGERHGYRNPAARQYAQRRVVDYFAAHL
jgi:dipeptidyl-peptidase 4